MDPFAKLVEDALKVLNPSRSPLDIAGDTPSPVSRDDAIQPKSQGKAAHANCSPPLKKGS
jgi:hypothetical protein